MANLKTDTLQQIKMQMDDLILYIQEAEKALHQINLQLTNKLSDLEFQIVIAEKLGYSREDSTKIKTHRLTVAQMLELIDISDLVKPEIIASIKFEYSILPEGVPTRIDEKEVRVNGEIWKINKYDKDHCPSNPHAHNIETGYKLHLGSGDLFNYKCDPLNKKIHKKDLLEIRERLTNFSLPILTV